MVRDLVRHRAEHEALGAGHASVADDDQVRALLLGDVEDRVRGVALAGERIDLPDAGGAGLLHRLVEQREHVFPGVDHPLQVLRDLDVLVAQALWRHGLGADDLEPGAQLPREVDRVVDRRRGGIRSVCTHDDRAEHGQDCTREPQASFVIAITIAAKTNTTIATVVQYQSRGIRPKVSCSVMTEPLSPALKAVSDAVLAVASQRSVDEVLQRLVDSARELAGARYAALGIPDGEGGFRRFLVAGMSDDLVAAMGPLPRTHGMLGAMLATADPFRTDDIHEDLRFRGWWPREHPDMRSFLGVPIVAENEVIGAFYLTEKEGAQTFGTEDQELIELLAAHASIAITNARLYERSRELSIVSERNRLALELHDVVSQKLFSLMLTAEAAATQLDRDPVAARAQVARLRELAREALDELRSLILGLRPPELERDGLEATLRKEIEMLRRMHGVEVELVIEDAVSNGDGARAFAVLRIIHEALNNAVRHAGARRIVVRLRSGDVEITDDGVGFEPGLPELRSRHLGLTSMEERARELGGRLEIRSSPGAGTTVRLELAR